MKRSSTQHRLVHSLVALLVFATTGCWSVSRPAARYLLPEGYVGWARIELLVPGAPPTPLEDGHKLYKFPPSGVVQTSSDFDYGMGPPPEFYYYTGESRRRLEDELKGGVWTGGMIQRQMTTGGGAGEGQVYMFVGTKDDYEKYGKLEGFDPPLAGPVTRASP